MFTFHSANAVMIWAQGGGEVAAAAEPGATASQARTLDIQNTERDVNRRTAEMSSQSCVAQNAVSHRERAHNHNHMIPRCSRPNRANQHNDTSTQARTCRPAKRRLRSAAMRVTPSTNSSLDIVSDVDKPGLTPPRTNTNVSTHTV